MIEEPWKVFMVYGSFDIPRDIPRENDKPLNFVVLRVPPKGVPWRKITQAINRLVKTFYPADTRAADRYCNLDGDITLEQGAKLGARLYEWSDGDLRLIGTATNVVELQPFPIRVCPKGCGGTGETCMPEQCAPWPRDWVPQKCPCGRLADRYNKELGFRCYEHELLLASDVQKGRS